MALYVLKPGDPIEASQYTAGAEDGFISFTKSTVLTNPIPIALQPIAVLWDTESPTGVDWTISIPYVGSLGVPVEPDGYIITPTVGDKYTMSKTEFEAKYMLDSGA